MPKCEYCGVEVELPFKCNFCGSLLCMEHRLPENHACGRQPPRTPLGSYQSKNTVRPKKSKWNVMESEGDFHFRKKKPYSYRSYRRKSLPVKKIVAVSIVLAIVALVIWQSSAIISLFQQSGNTKLTLPIGSFVRYGEQDANQVYEYTFRYGGPLADNPLLLQVWAGSGTFPKQLSVAEGTPQTVFALEVTVTEIHNDYLTISVRRLT